MKNFCCPGNAINFLKKEITLSLLILLNLSAYSHPIDKNMELKASSDFLSGSSLFPSFDHVLKNNPPEATHAVRPANCSYHLRRNSGSVASGASTGNEFAFTVRGNNCSWTPVSNVPWITNLTKSNMANLDDSWDVYYSCAANPNAFERSGTITLVTGYSYTVTQAASACSVSLPAATGDLPATAGEGSVAVAANGDACTWNAAVNTEATWISITAGQTFSGAKNLNYSYTANPTTSTRTATITVNEHTHTITQAASACSVSLGSATAFVPSVAGTGNVEVMVTGTNCQTWTATVSAGATEWLSITGESSGTATRTLAYSYTANTATTARTGTIVANGNRYTVTQAGNCTYRLRESSGRVQAGASTQRTEGEFRVITTQGSNCLWTPVANVPWITRVYKAPVSFGGGRDVYFSYTANPTTSVRTGTISVGELTYTVTQSGAVCAISLPANTGDAPATAGTGSFSVAANGNECTWTATVGTDAAGWLSIPTGQTLTGSKELNYSYGPNPSTTDRTGIITVNGNDYTVTQAGAPCSISLPSASGGVGFKAGRGNLQVVVEGSNCQEWTASVDPNAAWITIDQGDRRGTASKTLNFSYTANTSTNNSRTGTITVQGIRYTVTQAKTAACRYNLRRSSAQVPATTSSGDFLFNSYTENGTDGYCTSWTPVSTASWITNVRRGTIRNLDDSWDVYYSCTENSTASERSGTITLVPGYAFTITQAASATACTYTLDPAEANKGATASTAETTGSFSVTEQGTDCTWTPTTTDDWITSVAKAATANANGSWNVTYSFTANTTSAERRGTITVSDKTHTVIQAASATACTYTLDPAESNKGATASTDETKGSFAVTEQGTSCSWTPATTDDWITNVTKATTANANGSWNVTYSFAANTTTAERRGTITVVDKTHTVIQAGAAATCTYTLSSNTSRVPVTAGRKNVVVTTLNNCKWTATVATGAATWLTINTRPAGGGDEYEGTYTIAYSYAANSGAAEREGTITMGGQTYTVTQAGSTATCTYTLPQAESRIGADASTEATRGSFSVTTQGTECTAIPATTDNWISGLATVPGDGASGLWTVRYSYSANTSATERRGTITVADKTHTVIQAGSTTTPGTCSYTLSPTEVNIGAEASTEATRGSFSVTVEGTDCTWRPEPGNVWINNVIKVTPANADGTWTVTYTYMANTNTAERRGTITVGDKTYTVIQAGGATCSITLSKNTESVPAETGSSAFLILANDQVCEWTATVAPDATWLTIDEGQQTNGTFDLFYTYETNPNATPRTGIITVSGNTYTITQEGRTTTPGTCSYTLSPTEVNIGSAASTEATRGSFSVTVEGTDCTWRPEPGNVWINNVIKVTPANADGTWTVTYTYMANTNTAERRGTITVGDKTYTVIQAGGATCSITLSKNTESVPAETGSSAFLILANDQVCEWTATVAPDATWLTIDEGQQTNGTFDLFYTYETNPNATPRTGIITVSGNTYTITQEGRTTTPGTCSYTLSPTEVNIGSAASTEATRGSFSVTVEGTDCTWRPEAGNVWINNATKVTPANADGTWTVTYTYMANTGTAERRGTITVGDKTYTVIQAGGATCSITLSKNTGSVPAETGSDAFLVLSNGDACEWTATVAQDATWLTIDEGQIMIGTTDIFYTYETNPNATPRTGTITVAGHTYTITQEGRTTTPGTCSYTLSPTEANIGVAASTEQTKGSFSVTTQGTGCTAIPATTDNWITGLATVPVDAANGLWSVTYSYLANTSATERRGTITLGDQTHTVIQAGTTTTLTTCSYTLSPAEVNIGSAASTEQTKGSFSVTVEGTDCSATPSTSDNWITRLTTVAGDAANGVWSVTYSYEANPADTPRTGKITVAGQTHTVIQAGIVTGIEPVSSVKLFPNPAKDFVTVDLSTEKTKYVSLKIVNQAGQILYKVDAPPAQALQIPLHGFTGGLYFILLQGESKAWVEKLIVK